MGFSQPFCLTATDFQKDTYALAETSSKYMSDKITYCNEKWFALEDNNLWSQVKQIQGYINAHMHTALDNKIPFISSRLTTATSEEERDKMRSDMQAHMRLYANLDTSAYRNGLKDAYRKLLKDNKFAEKLDNQPYKIAFENGIYDIKTQEFRKGINPTDLLTNVLPYNYEKERNKEHEEWLLEEFKKICNYNETHRDYYFSVLGYALCGDAKRYQHVYCLVGQTASNGKSTIFSILTQCFPVYVASCNSDMIDVNFANKRHKHLVNFKGKRIVWMEEIAANCKCDMRLMKTIGDGDTLTNEVMFGTTENIKNNAKMFMLTNHTIQFDKDDNGGERRYKHIQLDSQFPEDCKENDYDAKVFKRDDKFKEKVEQIKMSLFHILMDYAHKVYIEGLPDEPKEFIEEKKETMSLNRSKLKQWIHDNIDFTDDDTWCSKKSIKEAYEEDNNKASVDFEKELRDIMKQNKVIFNSQKRNNGRGCFKGVVIRVEEEEEE